MFGIGLRAEQLQEALVEKLFEKIVRGVLPVAVGVLPRALEASVVAVVVVRV